MHRDRGSDHSGGRPPAPAEALFVIKVEDTGIGIQPEHLERISLPFDQADNSITRKFGGTGLGLTICRHIVRELGGEITVQSQPGRGSTLRVVLETGPLNAVGDAGIVPRRKSAAVNDSTLPIESTLPTELPGFRRIVDTFVGKLPVELEEMHSACSSGDWTRLERLVDDESVNIDVVMRCRRASAPPTFSLATTRGPQ